MRNFLCEMILVDRFHVPLQIDFKNPVTCVSIVPKFSSFHTKVTVDKSDSSHVVTANMEVNLNKRSTKNKGTLIFKLHKINK